MAYKKHISSLLLQLILLAFVFVSANGSYLKLGFYQKTCPNVEAIVAKVTADHISVAPSLAAPLLRMHFHDCFIRVRRIVLITRLLNFYKVYFRQT